jgi:hypothetical protein
MLNLALDIWRPATSRPESLSDRTRALFIGSKGVMLDYTDTSKIFQDAARTTPITADGQLIGGVTDLSGNAAHGSQTGVNRPIYRTGLSRAEYTGTQWMTHGSLDMTATDKVTVIAAVTLSVSGNCGLVDFGNSTAGGFNVGYFSGNATWRASLYGSTGNAQTGIGSPDFPAIPHTRVLSVEFDLAGAVSTDEAKFRLNGDSVTTSSIVGPAGSGNMQNGALVIGRTQGVFAFQGAIARLFIIGRALTNDEKFIAESWAGQSISTTILTSVPPLGDVATNHVISYGQSLSVGTQSRAAVSTTSIGNLMSNSSVRAWDGTPQWTSLVAHVENDSGAELMGETPLFGAFQIVSEVRGGYGNQFIASAPGFGAVTLADLSSGGGYYTRLLDDVTKARKLARASGKHYKVRAIVWMQGESDGGNTSYASQLDTFFTGLNSAIKAITNQTDDVWLLSYQLDRPQIGLAHLAASDTYSRMRVAMPIYHLARTDGVHLTAAASKIAGAYFGLTYNAIVLNGNTSWQPLKCLSSSKSGTTLDLVFNPVGSLAFDTTAVSAQTNQGFKLFDAVNAPVTINSVALLNSTTVRITASSTVQAGWVWRYGFSDPTDHTANASKGNLRDSQGDTITFIGGGLNYAMHNWALLQQGTIL